MKLMIATQPEALPTEFVMTSILRRPSPEDVVAEVLEAAALLECGWNPSEEEVRAWAAA